MSSISQIILYNINNMNKNRDCKQKCVCKIQCNISNESKIVLPERKIYTKQDFFTLAGNPSSTNQGLSITGTATCDDGVYVTGNVYIDANNNYYDFSGEQQHTILLNVANAFMAFVAKLSNKGKQIFFKIAGYPITGSVVRNSGVNVAVASSDNNVYVTGYISIDNGEYYDFNGNIITDPHYTVFAQVAFVAKISSSGNQEFLKIAGSFNTVSFGFGITTIKSCNKEYIYLTGTIQTYFSGSYYDFDNTTLIPSNLLNSHALFVSKLADDGTQIFFKIAGASGTFSKGIDIKAIDSLLTGISIYLTGFITLDGSGNYYDFIGQQTTSKSSWSPIFIAKIDNNDNQVFFELAGGFDNYSMSQGLSLVPSDEGVYVTGNIQISNISPPYQYYDFSSLVTPQSTTLFHANSVAFVAKLSNSGTQIFFTFAGNLSIPSQGNSITLLHDGVYITGNIGVISSPPGPPFYFGSYYDFNSNLITPTSSSLPNGFFNGCELVFVAKLLHNGTQVFFKVASNNDPTNTSGTGKSISPSIIPRGDNNVVKPDFDCVWITGLISLNSDGSYYDFNLNQKQSNLTGFTVAIFVAKLLADGTQNFFEIAGSPGQTSNGLSIVDVGSYDEDGGIYLTGNIATDSNGNYYDFKGKLQSSLLTSSTAIFVSKLKTTITDWYFVSNYF